LPFGWVLLVGLSFGLAALGLGLLGADESLWVDELHTSWVISDNPDQVAARAAAGNQSPWYFILVLSFEQLASTVGNFLPGGAFTPEWKLRLPSIVAWSLTTGFACAYLIQSCQVHPASFVSNRLRRPVRGARGNCLGSWCVGLAGQLRRRAFFREKEDQSAKLTFFPGDSKALDGLDRTHTTNCIVADRWWSPLGEKRTGRWLVSVPAAGPHAVVLWCRSQGLQYRPATEPGRLAGGGSSTLSWRIRRSRIRRNFQYS
jgi:hypothetical protein